MENRRLDKIDARPVKRFFVEMLTRDIQLEDVILDLLDNCVDGILRSSSLPDSTETPYAGFWAKIRIEDNSFEIEDNCGGIPWSERDRAFRMGRPAAAERTEAPLSVGVYGIGMKRAIFKIGKSAFVMTQNGNDRYQVLFTEEWMNSEDNWDLEVEPHQQTMPEDGTHILIQDLNEDVRKRFADNSFKSDLVRRIASHYAFIIQKGFSVEVNGNSVAPNPLVVRFSTDESTAVRPYMFRSKLEGVEVFLAVGLREPIPGFDRISEEQEGVRFSSDYAGWTVICNDRVVLYCDRSELTGWGLYGVPRYHNQFIAISGIVEFRGDPAKLPTTTTKRGLKFESSLYQQVLQRMIEGIKYFTDFTNKWKTMESEAERVVSQVPALHYSQIKEKAQALSFSSTRVGLKGEQYIPKLPMPPRTITDVRISYTRSKDEVLRLAEELFPDEIEDMRDSEIPRRVGVAAFEFAYKHFFPTDDR